MIVGSHSWQFKLNHSHKTYKPSNLQIVTINFNRRQQCLHLKKEKLETIADQYLQNT